MIKDWQLKNQTYADKIRISAGTTISNLDRWKRLSLRYFQDIEPLITVVDIEMVKTREKYHVRDLFWIGLDEKWLTTYQRIIDEKIEMAYTDLYAYDRTIGDLYIAAINELRLIDEKMHKRLRLLTQDVILNSPEDVESTILGNDLRELCAKQANYCEKQMDLIIIPFRDELMKLVTESEDSKIIKKIVKINNGEEVFNKYITESRQKIDTKGDILMVPDIPT